MKYLLWFALFLPLGNSYASQWAGTVIQIKAQTISKTVLFRLSGDIDSPARCNEANMYAIDLQSPGGKVVFDLIKYAYLNQLPVTAKSLHTCEAHWKSEGVKEIVLQQP